MEFHEYVGGMNPGVWGLQLAAATSQRHYPTRQRTMLRVRSLAVTCARGVSRSSCAARGGVARPATVYCATQRAFSDSSRNLAQRQPPPPSAGSREHDDRTHSERAAGVGGAMHGSQQRDGEVEEAGYVSQRQMPVVSYRRSSDLVLRLALYLNNSSGTSSSAFKSIELREG